MNKHLFFSGLAATILLAGCSGNEELSRSNPPIVLGNSEVPIQFGSIDTRAAVNPDADGNFETDNIGLFCLATGFINGDENFTPINWTTYNSTATPDGWSVWINNAKAKATIKGSGAARYTEISWTPSASAPAYYPLGDWHTYSFGAYFPYSDKVNFNYIDSKPMSARVIYSEVLDGTQDIAAAWAMSTEKNAYSARYFRENPDAGKPVLNFTRFCAKLRFVVKGGDGEQGVENLGISKVELLSQPKSAYLVFKGFAEPYLDLRRSNSEEPWQTYGPYVLKDAGDKDLTPVFVDETDPTTPKEVGQGFFLPIEKGVSTTVKYTLNVTVKDKNTGEERLVKAFFKPAKDLEAGKQYTITFTLHADSSIELLAKLADWEDGGSLYDN